MKQSLPEPETISTKNVPNILTWAVRKIEKLVKKLSTDAAQGLSVSESKTRLDKKGPNTLPETHGTRVWVLLLRQFKIIIIRVLIAAVAVSAFLGVGVDAIAIFTMVFLNAQVGFNQGVQKKGAEKSIMAQRKITTDAHLVEAARLRCVESALTVDHPAAVQPIGKDLIYPGLPGKAKT